jgi:hypothetical protein
MTPRTPRLPATIQLHLPILQPPASVVPEDTQVELILALVELLIGAAHISLEDGGDDESEAHR